MNSLGAITSDKEYVECRTYDDNTGAFNACYQHVNGDVSWTTPSDRSIYITDVDVAVDVNVGFLFPVYAETVISDFCSFHTIITSDPKHVIVHNHKLLKIGWLMT